MYDCMCLKVSVNYGQRVKVFVFFHKTGWVNIILMILNLEGYQKCMIGSKVTAILMPFVKKKNQKLQT